jgi:isopentenyldiphosphate isomerase
MTKDLLPGKWDTSVGGHISPGESVETALCRETEEELGLKNVNNKFNRKYIWESARERELVYSFTGFSEEFPQINRDEIDEGCFWPVQEIKENLGTEIFTPNFEHEFKMLFITTFDIINIPDTRTL